MQDSWSPFYLSTLTDFLHHQSHVLGKTWKLLRIETVCNFSAFFSFSLWETDERVPSTGFYLCNNCTTRIFTSSSSFAKRAGISENEIIVRTLPPLRKFSVSQLRRTRECVEFFTVFLCPNTLQTAVSVFRKTQLCTSRSNASGVFIIKSSPVPVQIDSSWAGNGKPLYIGKFTTNKRRGGLIKFQPARVCLPMANTFAS